MNYKKIYDDIVSRSKLRGDIASYTERHHIIPKCMGGSDEDANIAILTAREHYICHWLLYRIHGTRDLAFAWNMMSMRGNSGRRYTSHTFAYARRLWVSEMSKLNSGVKFSEERKRRLSEAHIGQVAWNKGIKTGRTEAWIQSRKNYLKNPKLCKMCNKIIKYKFRDIRTYCSNFCAHSDIDNPARVASAKIERFANSGSFKRGERVSERVASKISASMTGMKRPRSTCPHCGKEGATSLLKRWHFDNCKEIANANN